MKKTLFFLFYYFINHFISRVPSNALRFFAYKIAGLKIGKGSSIHMHCFIFNNKIFIGNNSVINRSCFLDGRGEIHIGNNVSISPGVQLITGTHDPDSTDFKYITKNITIEDFVWIGTSAIILPGVTLKKGTVVAAGSIVTKPSEPMTIIGGNPARLIRKRSSSLQYTCGWNPPFL